MPSGYLVTILICCIKSRLYRDRVFLVLLIQLYVVTRSSRQITESEYVHRTSRWQFERRTDILSKAPFPSVVLPSLKTWNFPFTGNNLKFVNSLVWVHFARHWNNRRFYSQRLLITKLSLVVLVWWGRVWCTSWTLRRGRVSALASAVSPADNCCPIRGFMFSRCLLHSFYSRLWLSPQASAVPSPHFSSFALLHRSRSTWNIIDWMGLILLAFPFLGGISWPPQHLLETSGGQ